MVTVLLKLLLFVVERFGRALFFCIGKSEVNLYPLQPVAEVFLMDLADLTALTLSECRTC